MGRPLLAAAYLALARACSAPNKKSTTKLSSLELVMPTRLPGMSEQAVRQVEHTDAMFGRPRYSSSITEKIIAPNFTLCDADLPEGGFSIENTWPMVESFWPLRGNFLVIVERVPKFLELLFASADICVRHVRFFFDGHHRY